MNEVQKAMCNVALGYIDRGWPVFPIWWVHDGRCGCGDAGCKSPGKHPWGAYAPAGLKNATSNANVICLWFANSHIPNIGIPTGRDTFIVLDVDPKNGGTESLKQLDAEIGPLPPPTVRTGGGGLHYYFRPPTVTIKNSAGAPELGVGLDVRGDGGYVVVAPSTHHSGGTYDLLVDLSENLPEIPPKLLEKLLQIEAKRGKKDSDAPPAPIPLTVGSRGNLRRAEQYAAAWPGVVKGQRNTGGEQHAACLTHDFALSEDEAWPILCNWNAKNDPPMTEKELHKCLKSGLKYGNHAIGEKLSALPFKNTLGVNSPKAKEDRTPPTSFAHTDAGRAELFAYRHSDTVRFCRGMGWLRYDGRRWTAQGAFDLCRQFVIQDARATVIAASTLDDDEKRRATIEYAIHCESAAKVQAALSLAESMPSLMVASDSLNRDIYLLNSWNGTVDLRNGMLRPHDPNDLLTKITPVQFDPKADSSLWLGHLRRVLGDNAALMEFVQTAAGYSATGDIGEEVLFLVHGPAAGGKTTTVEALKTALGEYAVTADFETFLKRQAGGIRNDIARLAGARLVTSVEVDEGQTLAEGLVKQWTGGDRITARFLHHEHIEFRPEGKLWLVCNEPPKARDTDDALWRRILRVPFEHTIPKPERDPNTKKLLTNPEVGGPAVLAWIVAGCEKWRKSGLMIPRLIETATQELRESQDPLRDFFTEKCEFLDEASIPVKALRQAYEQFATEQGIRYTLGPQQFNQRIEARGCKRMTKRYYSDAGTETLGKCWVGVGIQNQHQRRAVTHDLL